jgi:hydroxyacylglutathione hydrolase
MVGGVRLDVIFSPGHTPEHIMFLLTDSNTDKPYALFSGDCLFVGDMGRPDLLETFISAENDRVTGAKRQYANMLRLKEMSDYIQVFPGHGAGSACGKALGAVPSSTLGYEKLVNPAFQQPDEESFVNWLLAGQPEAPAYFARMKIVNQVGPSLLADLDLPQNLDVRTLDSLLDDDNVMVIDARAPKDFAAGHIAGAFHMPGTSDLFSTYVGWYVDYDQPVYLIAEEGDIPRLIHELRAIGVDNLPGYFIASELDAMTAKLEQVNAQTALQMQKDGATILDVRNQTERDEQYIPGSQFIPLGYIMRHLDEIPRDRRVIVHCNGGVRSQVVASVLRKQGFTNIENLEGGIDAWKRANLPLKTDG